MQDTEQQTKFLRANMQGVAVLADAVAENWQPLPRDNPFFEREREALEAMGAPLETARKAWDTASEQAFKLLYGDRDHRPGHDD